MKKLTVSRALIILTLLFVPFLPGISLVAHAEERPNYQPIVRKSKAFNAKKYRVDLASCRDTALPQEEVASTGAEMAQEGAAQAEAGTQQKAEGIQQVATGTALSAAGAAVSFIPVPGLSAAKTLFIGGSAARVAGTAISVHGESIHAEGAQKEAEGSATAAEGMAAANKANTDYISTVDNCLREKGYVVLH